MRGYNKHTSELQFGFLLYTLMKWFLRFLFEKIKWKRTPFLKVLKNSRADGWGQLGESYQHFQQYFSLEKKDAARHQNCGCRHPDWKDQVSLREEEEAKPWAVLKEKQPSRGRCPVTLQSLVLGHDTVPNPTSPYLAGPYHPTRALSVCLLLTFFCLEQNQGSMPPHLYCMCSFHLVWFRSPDFGEHWLQFVGSGIAIKPHLDDQVSSLAHEMFSYQGILFSLLSIQPVCCKSLLLLRSASQPWS